jgi:hypothetical protein
MNLARALAAVALGLVASCDSRVDFDATVDRPAFALDSGPVVLFDEGHNNRHRMGDSYRPFAELVRNDGFRLQSLSGRLTREALKDAAVLVIVCAQSQTDTNQESAFTQDEVRAVTQWVRTGGSLLLVTDHYPFPNAAEPLANAFGLKAGKGMALDEQHDRPGSNDDSRLIFSRANGLLAASPITNGRGRAERVELVETFTGDAFRSRDRSGSVMSLAPSARILTGVPHVTRNGSDTSVSVEFVDPRPAAGWSQGLAFPYGSGRVVALAEAAMLTAQEDGGRKIGMNAPGNDNRQFVINILNWLGRAL